MSLREKKLSTETFGWIVLTLIVLWGGLLRFHALDSQSLWIDESFSALAAEKIVATGSPQLDSGRYYGRSKPHTYLRALCIKVLGKNALSLRLPSSLFGTAMILLAALSCRIFYGHWLPGLIAALLVAFNYYEIAWSRQIRMYMEYQFFFSLTLLLLYLWLAKRKNSIFFLGLLLLSTAITLLLHQSAVLIIIPTLIMAFCYRRNLSTSVLAVPALLITMSLLLYCSRHGLQGTLEGIKHSLSTETLSTQFSHYFNFLLQNHSLSLAGTLLSLLFLLKSRKKEDIIFITSFLTILVIASSRNGIILRSIFFIYPLLFYTAAHGISQAGELTASLFHKGETGNKQASLLAVTLTLGLTFTTVFTASIINGQYVLAPQKDYFLEYDTSDGELNIWDYTPQPDYNAAYHYIETHRSDGDVFIVAHTALHHWYMPESKSYWLGFLFLHDPKRTSFVHKDSEGWRREAYMGYPIISGREDLETIFANQHGFVIIDYYSMSTRTPPGTIKYLLEQAPVVFHNDAHPDRPWTRVWVGRF